MATYWRGFADGIADWTQVELTSGHSSPAWSVVSTDQLQATSASSHNEALVWDDIDADGDRDDVEILCQVYVDSTSTTQRYLGLRISTSGSSRTGYAVRVRSNSIDTYRFNGSTYTAITNGTFSVTSGTWCWVRFRVNGSTIQARAWADGDSEPGTWQCSDTDTTYTTLGHVGAIKGANTNTQLWRKFGVGTNGDTAPSSAPSSGNTIAVPAGALTLTKYAPTVVATANQTVAVPAGSLTLTAYAPTVTAGANQVVAVPAGSLSLTGFAPTVQVTSGSTILVPAGALSLTGYAPTVVNPNTVAVPAGSITLTGYAPTVVVRADQIVAVPAATLTLTGFAPGVAYTANNTISVPAGALSLTGYAPTVSNGEVVEVKRQTGAGRPRRRQRVVIAIDGEDFVVESEEEAVALLDQAKEAAQEKAEQAIKRAAAARKREPRKVLADARKALEVPTITAEGMSDYAAETVAAIEELYRSAMRTIEVAAMLSRRDRDEEDDEEVLLLLA